MKRKARIARCFTDQPIQANSDLVLDKRSSHHLSTVLRAKVGTNVQLFNGDGNNYCGQVSATGRKTCVSVTDIEANESESTLSITLVQAIARGDKMDGIIQKATELGVNTIQPIYTSHSINTLETNREERKRAHWQSIVISACEQCGRSVLPQIQPISSLQAYLHSCEPSASNEHRWILSPAGDSQKLASSTMARAVIMVGPESGFDQNEVQLSVASGFTELQLGPRVLRTETAGPAAIAIIQARYGDID